MMKRNSRQSLSHQDLIDFLEHANDLIQSVSPDGHFLYVNKAWKETLGYTDEDLKNITFFDIIAKECHEKCILIFQEVLSGKEVEHVETVFCAKDGRLVHLEGSCNCRFKDGKPISTRGIFRDITEKKRIEEEKIRLQKRLERAQLFESLGIMAGGIAHDYNNILMGILGFTELLKMKASSTEDVLRLAQKVESSALRAAELTKQMLAFSGAGNISLVSKDLSSLIEGVASQLKAIIPTNIRLSFELDKSLPEINIDESQIVQALINTIKNSVEAIGTNKGEIKIRTGKITIHETFFDDTFVVNYPSPGEYEFIQITDTGHGINEKDAQKVFEPFYTTKFQGRGLGLSAALGIVRGHGGTIRLSSSKNKGTTLTMYFPIKKLAKAKFSRNQSISIEASKYDFKSPVLLIDDETMIRQLLSLYLKDMGLNSIEAEDGLTGIELFKRFHKSLKLVVLDWLMPGLDGAKVLDEIKKIDKNIPVLVISGYDKSKTLKEFPRDVIADFLQKPFSSVTFKEKVLSLISPSILTASAAF